MFQVVQLEATEVIISNTRDYDISHDMRDEPSNNSNVIVGEAMSTIFYHLLSLDVLVLEVVNMTGQSIEFHRSAWVMILRLLSRSTLDSIPTQLRFHKLYAGQDR